MYAYRLEDRQQDQQFLSGETVICRAVLKTDRGVPAPGDLILIQLSTGKKYKGEVVNYSSFQMKEIAAGDLTIRKAQMR